MTMKSKRKSMTAARRAISKESAIAWGGAGVAAALRTVTGS